MKVARSGDVFTQFPMAEPVVSRRGFDLNGSELIDVFASIRTPDELFPFLEMCGPFRDRGNASQSITWFQFQQWQELIRSLQDHRVPVFPSPSPFAVGSLMEAIVDPDPDILRLESKTGRRQAMVHFQVETALEYLGAVIAIEDLRETDWIACKLPSCNKRFMRKTAHENLFCMPAHGRQYSKWLDRKEKANGKA